MPQPVSSAWFTATLFHALPKTRPATESPSSPIFLPCAYLLLYIVVAVVVVVVGGLGFALVMDYLLGSRPHISL